MLDTTMITTWKLVIIFSAISIVSCQYDYREPGNQLGYNIFGQPYTGGDMSNGGEIPGEAERDYPLYAGVPDTGFSCDQQRFPGYYADPDARCQAFYICQRDGQSDAFLCPNGTVFNQEWLVCDWWYNFDCARAESLYIINEQVVRAMEEADNRVLEYRFNAQNGLNVNAQIGINGPSQLFTDQGGFNANAATRRNGEYGDAVASAFGRDGGNGNRRSGGRLGGSGRMYGAPDITGGYRSDRDFGRPAIQYGSPGVSGYNRRFGGFVANVNNIGPNYENGLISYANGDPRMIYGVPGAPGYQKNFGGNLDREYLPPAK